MTNYYYFFFKYHFMGVGQWSLAKFIEFSDFNDQLSA